MQGRVQVILRNFRTFSDGVVARTIAVLANYQFRTVLTGVSLTIGLAIADDLTYAGGNGDGSLMIFTDPSACQSGGRDPAAALRRHVARAPTCGLA
jgi:hypothetical protein